MPANLIVACDDVALPFGMIRVRGARKRRRTEGLEVDHRALGTQEFARVRLGVKPDHPVGDLSSFVLSPIPKRDREELDQMLDRAADAVDVIMLNEQVLNAQCARVQRTRS